MNTENIGLPASFRVIGVGAGIEDVINNVKLLGLDGISTEIPEPPYECIPNDGDKLAVIIFTDLDDTANRIANTFHDAGVMTIGFSEDANPSCYDSIILSDLRSDYPKIIKDLLQPIVTPGLISYDFYDLSAILRDSGYLTVKSAESELNAFLNID